jgi:hypothetical protein
MNKTKEDKVMTINFSSNTDGKTVKAILELHIGKSKWTVSNRTYHFENEIIPTNGMFSRHATLNIANAPIFKGKDRADLVDILKKAGFDFEVAYDTEQSAKPKATVVQIEDGTFGVKVENPIHADIPQTEIDGFVISLPKEGYTDEAIQNFRKLIESKETLLKKALGTDELQINVTDEHIEFPWWVGRKLTSEQLTAYTTLICAIGRKAKAIKRVVGKDNESTNEKYDLRIWLVGLGLNGNEHKATRNIILKNLDGSSAFKDQGMQERWNDKHLKK